MRWLLSPSLRWGASRCALTAALVLFDIGFSFSTPSDSLIARAVADGYWSAAVDPTASAGVTQGSLFRFRGIDVHDERGQPLEGFSIRGFAGEPASRKNIEALQTLVRQHLLNHGFPFAVIQSRVVPDSSGKNAVDVELSVHRGYAYKLGGVRLLETRTRPGAAMRLALWQIGEPFSQERIGLGLRRLSRTGYYESAELAGLFRDSTRNLIHPVLRLPDLQDNHLSGLLGYDSKAGGEKLTGYADLHLINLFGTARDMDFTFDSRTGNEREVRFAYVEPWILKLPVGVRLELDFLQQDTLYWELNRNLVFFQDLGFNSRMEVRVGDQANSDAASGAQSHALQSGLSLLFDGRDRVPLPASGYRAQIGVTGLRREIDDSLYYLIQLAGVAESWIPLTSRLGLKLGLHAATNLPLSHLNRGDLYYVGGANSLRGYPEREFPTNAYAFGQFEVQTWLGRRGRLFAFTDPGLVNRLVAEYSWRRVFGYGAGIELSKGDWSLSLSYALSPERAVGDGLLHVGVDNGF